MTIVCRVLCRKTFISNFRTRADEVLKRATKVSDALEDAEQAQVRVVVLLITKEETFITTFQKAARDAIKKANEDISTAKSDLEEVSDEAFIES